MVSVAGGVISGFSQDKPFPMMVIFVIPAFSRAAMVVLRGALLALNQQQMATVIGTIDMVVTWFSALMALRNHLPIHRFTHSFIKYEIFAGEMRFQIH